MHTKQLPATVKALTDEGEGVVEALISTYDTDSVGDKVVPGAFAKTLAEWEESGDRIPVVWSHQHDDPFAHIGEVIEASETDDGLLAKMQFDLENPTARQAYRLIKGGRIRNYSFAYEVRNPPTKNEAGENLLTDLKVFEVGPTLIGANQNTRTISAKAATPYADLPLDDDRERDWDASAARARVASWAGGGESLSDMDWGRYRRAFFWYDSGSPEEVGSYKLPFADVIDGELRAIWRGVAASAAVLDGSRGGADIDDEGAVRANVARYYAKAREQFDDDSIVPPWESDGESSSSGAEKASRTVAGKAGRTLSAKNEAELRDAYDAIGRVLSQLDNQGKSAQPAAPANDEEPVRAKSEEPNQIGPADEALAAHLSVLR